MIGANVMDAVYCELCNVQNWQTIVAKPRPDSREINVEYAVFPGGCYVFRQKLIGDYLYAFVKAGTIDVAVQKFFDMFNGGFKAK